jgi:hypothetical protein
MAHNQSKETKEVLVTVGLGVLIVWVLFHYFKPAGAASSQQPTQVIVSPAQTVSDPSLSPVVPLSQVTAAPGTNTCQSCTATPYVIETVNQMAAQADAYANAIFAAGNATLQALALIASKSDPLLQVTVG